MKGQFEEKLLSILRAESLEFQEVIQELWSGYGRIKRYQVNGALINSIIVKEIDLSTFPEHPRGWNTDHSHQRKLKSYQIEANWYAQWSDRTDQNCRTAKLYLADKQADELFLAMEDLDESGFNHRVSMPILEEIKLGLEWLASFHATFMGEKPKGLWEEGSYWHLATRPDEWKDMYEGQLKNCANSIAKKLSAAKFQTILHGDAKLANFCFSKEYQKIAAVDFQYVGGGCGMKDVAYFLSSCPPESNWQANEDALLYHYFEVLKKSLREKVHIDLANLEQEWRDLYCFAWADFVRFLKGWMPEHWKIDPHSMKKVEEALSNLQQPST